MSEAAGTRRRHGWRHHVSGDGYGYGWLLLLITFTLFFQMAAPPEPWARVFTVFLQGMALVAALTVAGVHRGLIKAAWALAGFAFLLILLFEIFDSDYKVHGGGMLGLLLASLAPAALLWGILREARRSGEISLRTMFGVLCVYLLIGSAFSYTYLTIGAFDEGTFFAETVTNNPSDYLYFSFSTMTTVGFGDLTAAGDLGRSLAVTEALIGQIYLVTLVALIVGNLGRRSLRG